MKRLVTLILTLIISMCVFGQDLKPITKKGQGFIEQYFVLATDKKVKHGEYKRHDKNGKLIMLGAYENNKRFGQWKFYSDEELVQEYDFTNKTFKNLKSTKYVRTVSLDNQIKEIELESGPQYFGLLDELNSEFNKVSRYPEQAKRMGIEGKILVSAWIDENDEIIDIKVIRGIMDDCDKEVVKGLQQLEKGWIAGRLNGQPIKSQIMLVFEFTLDNLSKISVTM